MQHAIWELRNYRVFPGKAGIMRERFFEAAIPAFQRHGMKFCALWQDIHDADQFWYLLGFSNLEEREASWEKFRDDPLWQAAKSRSETDGPLIAEHSSRLLAGFAEMAQEVSMKGAEGAKESL